MLVVWEVLWKGFGRDVRMITEEYMASRTMIEC